MVEHALEIVRDELRQERRRMAVLQDKLSHVLTQGTVFRTVSSGVGAGTAETAVMLVGC